MTRKLAANDFTAYKVDGTVHGWTYEDEHCKVILAKCWDGCDVHVIIKKSSPEGQLSHYDHISRGNPTMQEEDVAQALATANAVLAQADAGL